jgi:hypothetical protein
VAAPLNAEKSSRPAVIDPSQHTIRVVYICERDHRPVHHGHLEFDLKKSVWLQSHDDVRVQKMADCFLESYLTKKSLRGSGRSEIL